MPDVPDRESAEQAYARAVARFLSAYNGRVLELVEEYMRPDGTIDPAILSALEELNRELTPELTRLLENRQRDTFLAQAEVLLREQAVGVEWGLVNEAAVEWARTYSFELVQGINDTTRSTLQRIMTQAFEEPTTLRDIRSQLAPTFGPLRAEMIATTETTRAAVEGERALVRELNRDGVEMIAVWQTRNDERVCPICGPLHEARQAPGGGFIHPDGRRFDAPPAHVRCRCWLNHETTVGLA